MINLGGYNSNVMDLDFGMDRDPPTVTFVNDSADLGAAEQHPDTALLFERLLFECHPRILFERHRLRRDVQERRAALHARRLDRRVCAHR